MSLPTTHAVTPAAYLRREELAEHKSEYEDGVVIAMPGGTAAHNQIIGNIFAALYVGVGDADFTVWTSDMRIGLPGGTRYYYPDISVVAGSAAYDLLGQTATLTNPCLLVEVLSKSTEQRDRGVKWAGYQTIPSLREYLLVDSTQVRLVQHWRASEDAPWQEQTYSALDETVVLRSVPAELPLRQVYRRVADIAAQDS